MRSVLMQTSLLQRGMSTRLLPGDMGCRPIQLTHAMHTELHQAGPTFLSVPAATSLHHVCSVAVSQRHVAASAAEVNPACRKTQRVTRRCGQQLWRLCPSSLLPSGHRSLGLSGSASQRRVLCACASLPCPQTCDSWPSVSVFSMDAALPGCA